MNFAVVSLSGLRDALYHAAEDLRNAKEVEAYRKAIENNARIWESLRKLAEAGHPLDHERVREDLLAKAAWVAGLGADGVALSDHVVEQLIVVDLQTYVRLRGVIGS